MYKVLKDPITGNTHCVQDLNTSSYIPFDPANTDYQTFKTQVLSDEAQLEDADGVLMTAEEAKAFVKELP